MRFPTLTVLGVLTLAGCDGGPAPVAPPLQPNTMAAFRVTHVESDLEGPRTEGSGPTAVTCGAMRILLSFEEIGGVGARIVRQETSVVEHDGGIQDGRSVDLDVAVPAGGRAAIPAAWQFCGQRAIDFPARLRADFTIRDDHGHEQVVSSGVVLAMP